SCTLYHSPFTAQQILRQSAQIPHNVYTQGNSFTRKHPCLPIPHAARITRKTTWTLFTTITNGVCCRKLSASVSARSKTASFWQMLHASPLTVYHRVIFVTMWT